MNLYKDPRQTSVGSANKNWTKSKNRKYIVAYLKNVRFYHRELSTVTLHLKPDTHNWKVMEGTKMCQD